MLKGKKIVLTAVSKSSLEKFMNWRNEPELRKYFREHREINEDMQLAWYENKVLKDPNQVNFEIREKERNKLIGHCGLYYIDWVHRHAEFGIYVGDQNYRNGGFGSDSLRTLIKYGFEDLNLNKIWCEVYANNSAIDVYEGIGFALEGVQRQHYFNEGKYWDSMILSMLREEWRNNE